MADTAAFYAVEPAPAAELDARGTLRFESAIRTPHAENNVVHARYFPTAGRRPARGGRGPAAMELRRRRPRRPEPVAGAVRHERAAPQPALSRRADAARARARRLHRQRQRRTHAAGVPPGGARCAPRGDVARRARLRAHRDSRHQPRLVPLDADRRARAADRRGRAQSRVAVLRRRGVGRTVDVARPRRGSRDT